MTSGTKIVREGVRKWERERVEGRVVRRQRWGRASLGPVSVDC